MSSPSLRCSARADSRRRSSDGVGGALAGRIGAGPDLWVASRRWSIWARMSGSEYSQERETPASLNLETIKVVEVMAVSPTRVAPLGAVAGCCDRRCW